MKWRRDRGPAALAIAVLVGVLLAACGGSGSPTSSTTTSTTSAQAAANVGNTGDTGGTGSFASRRAALAACLSRYGVTLPTFGPRAGATGASGRRFFGFGATGASGRRFFGFGPTGRTGSSGRRGALGALAANPRFATAFAHCASLVGGFGGRGASGRRGFAPTST